MNFWRVFAIQWACKRIPLSAIIFANLGFSQSKWLRAFEAQDPLALYSQNYPSFEVNSSSILTLKAVPANITFEANSNLKFQSSEINQLIRKSFIDDSPLELIINHSKASLRMPWQGLFQDTVMNPEIRSWVHIPLKEIMDLLNQAEFDDNLNKSPENAPGGKVCFHEKRGFLCFDPSTYLPLDGKLDVSLSATTYIQMRFLITIFKTSQKSTFKSQK